MFLSAYRYDSEPDINNPVGAMIDDCGEKVFAKVCPFDEGLLGDDERIIYRNAMLAAMVRMVDGSQPMFVKTHFFNGRVLDIPTIPMGLTNGAIYLVRDPRDVAVSFAHHLGEGLDDTIGYMARARFVLRNPPMFHVISSWSKNVKSWVDASRTYPIMAVRYEDMIDEPVTAFRSVLKFLHYEIDDDRIERAVEATSFDRLQAQEKANGFRERQNGEMFFRSGRAGSWVDALTDAQAKRIETAHGEMMREFGYL